MDRNIATQFQQFEILKAGLRIKGFDAQGDALQPAQAGGPVGREAGMSIRWAARLQPLRLLRLQYVEIREAQTADG